MFGKKSTEELLAETNMLLRELIAIASGQPLERPKAPQGEKRLRTDRDVAVTGRSHQIDLERQQLEKTLAPWRSGPDTPETLPNAGSAPDSSEAT